MSSRAGARLPDANSWLTLLQLLPAGSPSATAVLIGHAHWLELGLPCSGRAKKIPS
jgi:hypothetical protein